MNTTRTPQFYMANLGSEVSGIYSALSVADHEACHARYERAKKIITEWRLLEKRPSAVAEMDLLENIIDDLVSVKRKFKVPKVDMEAYFRPFALRVLSV